MPIGPLLTVFGFLTCRAATVSTSDVFLFLGLGFHLVILFARTTTTTKRNAVYQDIFKIAFFTHKHYLMVEKSDTSECHCDTVFVAGHDDMVVANRAASLGNELYAALVGTLDIITEGEEGIRA